MKNHSCCLQKKSKMDRAKQKHDTNKVNCKATGCLKTKRWFSDTTHLGNNYVPNNVLNWLNSSDIQKLSTHRFLEEREMP